MVIIMSNSFIEKIKEELSRELKIDYDKLDKLDLDKADKVVTKNNFGIPFKGSSFKDDKGTLVDGIYPVKRLSLFRRK